MPPAYLAASAAGSNRPALDAVVVVEGFHDMHAVHKAVRCPVLVCGAGLAGQARTAGRESTEDLVQEVAGSAPRLVLLSDPDVTGRQMRDTLDRLLTGRPPAHAQLLFSFIPAPRAVALSNSKYHQPGNVGVEHASPPSIRHALARCRPRQDSQAFTRQQLTDWGLVNDATDASAYSKDTALRRALFSNLLGLGDCNGKTLLRQLNQFGFAGQAMESKLKVAERRLAVLKQVLDCLQQDGFKMSHPHQIDAMVWAVELRLWLAFRSGKLPAAADALALSAHMFDEMQLPAGESSAIVANCFWDNRNRALGGATWPADGSRSRGVP